MAESNKTMTKKKLTWRLSDLPDAQDVAELVAQKIITPGEGREILFNEGSEDKSKIKALEEEVKFLRELCDTLAAKSNGWPTIIREYRDYRPHYPMWYDSYGSAIGKINTFTSSNTVNAAKFMDGVSTNGISQNATLTMANTDTNVKGLSSLN